MKHAFQQIKKHWVTNLVTFIISLGIFVAIFCIIFFNRSPRNIIAAIDGVTIGSLVLLLGGALMWMAHLGTFDIFAFGFKQMFGSMFAKDPRQSGTYQDYKQSKTEKRDASSFSFVIVILTGLLCSISILVLEIIFQVLLNS